MQSEERPERSREEREKIVRAETVEVLSALSRAYTQTTGHKALKHWARMQSALEMSLTGVATIGQWQETIRSELQIQSLSSYLSSAFERHESALDECQWSFFDWLFLVRREVAWFVAHLRLESEARKEAREAAEAQKKGRNK